MSLHSVATPLIQELHARPAVNLTPPMMVWSYAWLADGVTIDKARLEIIRLLGRPIGETESKAPYFSAQLADGMHMRFETHTEFYTVTLMERLKLDKTSDWPEPQARWLSDLPGQRLIATSLAVVAGESSLEFHQNHHVQKGQSLKPADMLVHSRPSGGSAEISSDFILSPQGYISILVQDQGMSESQTGRLCQRLQELVVYGTLAMLALPEARKMGADLRRLESELADLALAMTKAGKLPEQEGALMQRLNLAASEVESMVASFSFRFGATRAYSTLVAERLEALREIRIAGSSTMHEFFNRRFQPAIRTAEATNGRLQDLALRTRRVGELLRTRIDHALQEQNADLLRTTAARLKIQLQMQKTVEGVSLVAISYYAVGLIYYLMSALEPLPLWEKLGIHFEPKIIAGASLPLVVGLIWLALRKLSRHLDRLERD